MKKIVKFAMVIVAMVAAFGCSKPDLSGVAFLDVTPNNINGVWRLESYDNGVKLAEGSYYYIVFDRAERTFVTYDNLGSMEACKNSGRKVTHLVAVLPIATTKVVHTTNYGCAIGRNIVTARILARLHTSEVIVCNKRTLGAVKYDIVVASLGQLCAIVVALQTPYTLDIVRRNIEVRVSIIARLFATKSYYHSHNHHRKFNYFLHIFI